MAEVLSQDEIDQLITAVSSRTEWKGFSTAADSRKIKIYDFKRPEKFSKEQIRIISIMHETFARLTTTSLSAHLSGMAYVHVASVDQLTYEEFIRSIPTPTTLAIINMDPLKSYALMEMDPDITFSIINRLLGGTEEETKFLHELTDIEQSIMEGIIVRLLGNLREAWMHVIDLRPRLGQIDTNPQFTQIVPSTEIGVCVTFETKIGKVEGMTNIFYPYLSLVPIIGNLSNQIWYSTIKDCIYNSAHENYVSKNNIPVTLTAELFTGTYSIKEIAEWTTKTTLSPVNLPMPDHCYLRLGDRYVWECEILPEKKHFKKQIKIKEYAERQLLMEEINVNINQSKKKLSDALLSAGIKVTVELGSTTKTIKEIFEMSKDTILELDKIAGEPVDVKANGVLIAKGEVVVIDENFGVRISEIDESPIIHPESELNESPGDK